MRRPEIVILETGMLRSLELELGGGNRLHAFRGLAFCIEGFGTVQDGCEARPCFGVGAPHRVRRWLIAELRVD
jgi:hypothetical protein